MSELQEPAFMAATNVSLICNNSLIWSNIRLCLCMSREYLWVS